MDRPGGIEVLDWREIETPHLGPDDALIHQTKIGLNFIDVYMTSGTYPFPENGPQIPGGEAAGVVAELGKNVSHLKIETESLPRLTEHIEKNGFCLRKN